MYIIYKYVLYVIICIKLYGMEWNGQEGQAAESVKKGDHSRRTAIRIYCTADNFQHPQNADADVELHVLGCRLTY